MALPIHILKGLVRLSNVELERKIKGTEQEFFINGKWNEKAKKNGIFFDLSQVRWVNIGAAVKLTLLAENARKAAVNVYISLPVRTLTAAERDSKKEDFQTQKEVNRKLREDAHAFLKTIRFERAVKCKHIDNSSRTYITDKYEFSKDKLNTESFLTAFEGMDTFDQEKSEQHQYRYKHIVPLTWIDCEAEFDVVKTFNKIFSGILSNPEKGLHQLDLLSIQNVILFELTKNVREHAGDSTRHALLSVGIMPSKSALNIEDEEDYLDKEHLKWLIKNSVNHYIEIYFGDSGQGLLTDNLITSYKKNSRKKGKEISSKEEKINVLRWSFDKWSSRKIEENIRGTKGLYRINRVVNKYNGLFLVRTKELHGGFQKGGYSSSQWKCNEKQNLFVFPGTLVELKLCPYTEITKFNFKFENRNSSRNWKTVLYHVTEESLINLDQYPNHFSEFDSAHNLLIIFTANQKLSIQYQNDFFSYAFEYLSHLRHPNGIVVFLTIGIATELQSILANSTSEILEREKESFGHPELAQIEGDKVYDPILILGNNSVNWFGGSYNVIKLLDEAYKIGPHPTKLATLVSYQSLSEEEKANIHFHFQNDDSLITLSDENELAFNFSNIDSFFESKLKSFLDDSTADSSDYCSPTLKIVDRWHKISELLTPNDVAGYALALYLKIYNLIFFANGNRDTYILIDNNQQYELAYEYAKLIGIDRNNIRSLIDDIDYQIPRRTKLFNKNQQVIVLTTIISSSETIRRLVKYAKRDSAQVLCIACLANYRVTEIETLHTWGDKIPIVSLFQKNKPNQLSLDNDTGSNQTEYSKLVNCKKFVAIDYENTYEENLSLVTNPEIPDKIKSHIVSTKALHYGHIGKYNGRHFTFYINARKLLEEYSFLWEEVVQAITKWMDKEILSSFVLVRPESVRSYSDPMNNIANHISSVFNVSKVITWNNLKSQYISIEEKNLVYIDFGSLTGSSINGFLSSVNNADNVLIVILFSQFQNGEQHFYKRINTIQVNKTKISSEDLQLSIFGERTTVSPVVTSDTAVARINFLYDFPFKYYNSTNCPICEQERSLTVMPFANEYMSIFATDRRRKINIRSKETVLNFPVDFYQENSSVDVSYEMSTVSIVKMYELSLLIDKAFQRTHYRIILFKYLIDIFDNIEQQKALVDSNLYAFLYLLSNEIYLLQREPFQFKRFREIISEIALSVCVHDLDDLTLKLTNKENELSCFKLAVRYKYAAISVLRGSNKYKFCENIIGLLKSAKYKDRLSNNLIQNTFFGIYSLHQNEYNKSIAYYLILEEKLSSVDISDFGLSQKGVYYFIKTNNLRIRRSIEWDKNNSTTPLNIIKGLKSEFHELYNVQSHPAHYESFVSLDFRSLDPTALPDLMEHRENSDYFESFQHKAHLLLEQWNNVYSKLQPIVKLYIDKMPKQIFESQLFRDLFVYERIVKIFGDPGDFGIAERFAHLIDLIGNDVLLYGKYLVEYNTLYDDIYNSIIKYKKVEFLQTQDSLLLDLLKNFPANIHIEVKKVFSQNEFKSFKISCFKDQPLVFFPKLVLTNYLLHIKNNLIKRLIHGSTTQDVDIEFCCEESSENGRSFVVLTIRYNGTENKNIVHKNGGLRQFEDELNVFEGSLYYDVSSEYFTIKPKFLAYDQP